MIGDEGGENAADDVVPAEQGALLAELPRQHAPHPTHKLQLRTHLVVDDQVRVQLLTVVLDYLLVDAIAPFDDRALGLLLFTAFVEALPHKSIKLLILFNLFFVYRLRAAHVGQLKLFLAGLGEGKRWLELADDLGLHDGECLGHLKHVAHAERHDPLEAPVDVGVEVLHVEDEVRDLVIAKLSDGFLVEILLNVDATELRFPFEKCFLKEGIDEHGEDLVHALAVADLSVFRGPQVQHVPKVFFEDSVGEQFDFLHGAIHVLLDDF